MKLTFPCLPGFGTGAPRDVAPSKPGPRPVPLSAHPQLDRAPTPSLASQQRPRSSVIPTAPVPAAPVPAAPVSAAAIPAAEKKGVDRLAASLYRDNRYYHGTNTSQAALKRSEGMDPKTKTDTSVDRAPEGFFDGFSEKEVQAFRDTAMSHLYFTRTKHSTTDETSAADYARMAANTPHEQPKLVRAYLPAGTVSLEADPDSPESKGRSVRTTDKVDAGYLLPSKNSPVTVTAASEAFRQGFNSSPGRKALKINTQLSSWQAAQLLHEQQTPSPTDFKDDVPWR